MKPRNIAVIEGILFTAIGVLTALADKVSGNEPLTSRAIATMICFALLGGLNAAKAFLSQSSGQLREPQTAEVPVKTVAPTTLSPIDPTTHEQTH